MMHDSSKSNWVFQCGMVLAALMSYFRTGSGKEVTSSTPSAIQAVIGKHCLDCHSGEIREGGLNLESLEWDLSSPHVRRRWELVYDRVAAKEMPPLEQSPISDDERAEVMEKLRQYLQAADRLRIEDEGRAAIRRLNREEFENTLRDVLAAPWLQLSDRLPADGVIDLFNKSAEALDTSHIHFTHYLEAIDYALTQATNAAAFPVVTAKYYAREEPVLRKYLRYRSLQQHATRSIMPLDGLTAEPDVIRGRQPITVGGTDPDKREREAMGVFCGVHSATTKYDFTRIQVPIAGYYKLRFKTYTFQAAPNGADGGDDHGLTGGERAWWRPDRNHALPGVRSEPITLYALGNGGNTRRLIAFDSQTQPTVFECTVALEQGDRIRPDAARLIRTRPGYSGNPNASPRGIPGVALNWLEITGPLHEEWPPACYRVLFDDLAFTVDTTGRVIVSSDQPDADARRLLLRFLRKATNLSLESSDHAAPFYAIYRQARDANADFTEAMHAAYTAILVSPQVLLLNNGKAELDPRTLATRLAYFLWNGPADEAVLRAIGPGDTKSLGAATMWMLQDARSERFIAAFLDYWLGLRDINANVPDADLYPDYFLDDLLTESSLQETRTFFRHLLERDLSVRNLVSSDFAFANERLLQHYGLPVQAGVDLRRVTLPAGSPFGGLITQASIQRVTANGTTTSPVVRGAWIAERLLGTRISPPPSGVGAVEPDIRGAKTIREQLTLHGAQASCHGCHRKFDGLGFALESFDIAGGWREHYRSLGSKGERVAGIGKNGHRYRYRLAQPVECCGQLPGIGDFDDIRALKQRLAADPRRLAENFLNRLIMYATGAPVSFSERAQVATMLDRAAERDYGLRTILIEMVQSELFRRK